MDRDVFAIIAVSILVAACTRGASSTAGTAVDDRVDLPAGAEQEVRSLLSEGGQLGRPARKTAVDRVRGEAEGYPMFSLQSLASSPSVRPVRLEEAKEIAKHFASLNQAEVGPILGRSASIGDVAGQFGKQFADQIAGQVKSSLFVIEIKDKAACENLSVLSPLRGPACHGTFVVVAEHNGKALGWWNY